VTSPRGRARDGERTSTERLLAMDRGRGRQSREPDVASMAKIARTMAFVGARVAITAAPAAPEALVRQAQLEIRDLDSRSINPFVHAAAALA